jgi:hypothetical protein
MFKIDPKPQKRRAFGRFQVTIPSQKERLVTTDEH